MGGRRDQQPAADADAAQWDADTYNHALRVWREGHLWTVPDGGLDEPGGLDVLPDGRIVVADTASHRVVVVDPVAASARALDVGRPGSVDEAAPVVAETLVVPAGSSLELVLDVELGGEALDAAGGPAVRVRGEASEPGLVGGELAWAATSLPARVVVGLSDAPGSAGRLTLELLAATCGPDACRLWRTQRAYDLVLT